jgi:glyoxylase-like metal-dependent hydrolase (beta-lactamase superfamily II)
MINKWHQALPRKSNLRFKKISGKSNWFEIYQLNPKTYAFLEPNHCEEVISYLIIGENKAVLFDSGMGIADIRSEVSSLTSLPIIVINSHSHYDHIGGNHQFQEIWSFENEFENSRIENGYSNSESRKYMTEESYINLPANIDLTTFCVPGVRIAKYLHRGETIDLGGRTLTVHCTPGETPGAISLSDDLFNIFFTGDLLHPGGMWYHQSESNWKEFSRSIDYLSTKLDDIQYICPAHNEFCVTPDFVDKVKQAIKEINNNISQGILKDEFLAFSFDGFSIHRPKV